MVKIALLTMRERSGKLHGCRPEALTWIAGDFVYFEKGGGVQWKLGDWVPTFSYIGSTGTSGEKKLNKFYSYRTRSVDAVREIN